ncbi:hypothetical protein GCWU000342_00229 [Shuttleworthella satelles DSM 14600]|uniref:Uncharacterized protein n=1 Tax=Shuttleworthella satelles DSM 14600 TaxID=626523 RepID=C4G8D3_9FIRM|nr:hypothetical protein GCWU000342_00229 [Shuttleworthia satelles DSM 14600]
MFFCRQQVRTSILSGGLDAVERWTAIGVSIKKRAQKGLFAGSKYSKMETEVSVYLWTWKACRACIQEVEFMIVHANAVNKGAL